MRWLRIELGRGDLPAATTGLLVVGALGLALLFVASYVGGLHAPRPHGAPLAVVGPTAEAVAATSAAVEAGDSGIKAVPYRSLQEAEDAIDKGDVFGALTVGATRDRLLVSQTWNSSFSAAIGPRMQQAFEQQGRQLEVRRVDPLPANDSGGLSPFYLTVGLVVGGYLAAVLLGLARRERPSNAREAASRVGVLAGYSILLGLLAALLVDPIMDVLPGSFLAIFGTGVLIVLASSLTAGALTAAGGAIGVGLAIALLVVLGNPSSGAIVPPELLPEPWRAIGGWIPTGAGGQALRSVQYFESAHLLRPLLVLSGYVIAATAVILALAYAAAPERKRT